jgi:HPt (histidine-containing phosphotransfer) domain-containing protein
MNEERFRTMPVVALTANAVSGMREMFLENGFDDFLSKPIDTAKLDAALKKWIPEGKRRQVPEGGENVPAFVEQSETTLPEIVGVDVAAGLARMGGSQKRYLELLEMFCRDAQAGSALLEKESRLMDHWAERFLAAAGFMADDTPLRSFTTQVHALKSALANIGADALAQTAALLEKAGHDGNMPVIRDKLPPFREEIAELMARIAELSAPLRSPDEKEGADPALREVLGRLHEALEAKDFDAMDAALAQAQSLPSGGETRGVLSEIADGILTSDLRKAEKTINDWLGQGRENWK